MKLFHKTHKDVQFTACDSIPMLDWDWPNIGHKTDECITISCLNDVLVEIKKYLERHPYQSVRIYVTPGGVRAFFLGKQMTVEEFFGAGEGDTMNADPMYVGLCHRRGNFPVRVSPKPNRPGDFVASYVCTLGAEPDGEMLRMLNAYHDKPIKRFRDTSVKIVTHQW